ncbi:hypothetical protein [Microbulbifer sp. ALW1]|uniref:hypothetical protein n=1 Tax=Microbulbifer sp. (strain ALW1) TaxID=1516059 RepID=UPI00135C526D|nr:hypothetical protein [Microbulbifer sp. ALW1]
MSNVAWRRIRVMARTLIEECEAIDKSPKLTAELNRIQVLADSSDELEGIPRIYTEAPQTDFAELPSTISLQYQEMLLHAKRLARGDAK